MHAVSCTQQGPGACHPALSTCPSRAAAPTRHLTWLRQVSHPGPAASEPPGLGVPGLRVPGLGVAGWQYVAGGK